MLPLFYLVQLVKIYFVQKFILSWHDKLKSIIWIWFEIHYLDMIWNPLFGYDLKSSLVLFTSTNCVKKWKTDNNK